MIPVTVDSLVLCCVPCAESSAVPVGGGCRTERLCWCLLKPECASDVARLYRRKELLASQEAVAGPPQHWVFCPREQAEAEEGRAKEQQGEVDWERAGPRRVSGALGGHCLGLNSSDCARSLETASAFLGVGGKSREEFGYKHIPRHIPHGHVEGKAQTNQTSKAVVLQKRLSRKTFLQSW